MELVLSGVPLFSVSQQEYRNFVTRLSFGDISRLIKGSHLYVPNNKDLPDFAQRKANSTRLTQISNYILSNYEQGNIFFPPICVNVHPQPHYDNGKIYLPYHAVSMRLTDGQHRCFGIHRALQALNQTDPTQADILAQLEIGVLLYSALPLDQERQAFRDQNLLVQRPSVSLAHYFDQRSPHVRIAKHLLHTLPPFQDNIETIESGLGKQNPKLLTLSTLVTATKFMFSGLKETDPIDTEQQWATHFWQTAAHSFADDPWQPTDLATRRQQRQTHIHTSAVLFQALGMIAHDLRTLQATPTEIQQHLGQLSTLDWRKDNPFWLNHGITQMGTKGTPIISNTHTTVKLCYQTLKDCLGLATRVS